MKAILCFFLTVFSCCRVWAGGRRTCVRCSDLALPCPLSLPGRPLQAKAMVPWWSRSLPPSLTTSPQTRKKPTLARSEAGVFVAFAPDPNLLCFWEITAVPGEWWCEDVTWVPRAFEWPGRLTTGRTSGDLASVSGWTSDSWGDLGEACQSSTIPFWLLVFVKQTSPHPWPLQSMK